MGVSAGRGSESVEGRFRPGKEVKRTLTVEADIFEEYYCLREDCVEPLRLS